MGKENRKQTYVGKRAKDGSIIPVATVTELLEKRSTRKTTKKQKK
jgi:hypothetical protein